MITDEDLPKIVQAFEDAGGNRAEAARQLGIPVETFKYNLKRAERKGLTGNTLYGPALEGYEFTSVSTQVDKDGNAEKEWSKQKPTTYDRTYIPEGHALKGLSTLVGPDGQRIAQWVKTREEQQPADLVERAKAALVGFERAPEIAPPTKPAITNLMAFYPIADNHRGMYSWARQTGQNYDQDIADRALTGSYYRLIQMTPDAEKALVAFMGDYFHADDPSNKTPKSGNQLDIDTRFEKVLQGGVKAGFQVIDMALQKHLRVDIEILRGNHDPNSAFVMSLLMAEHYANNPRVNVSLSPAPFRKHEWGRVMLGLHHGDTVKAADFPMVMAAVWPEAWGRTEYRYAFSGHLHKKAGGKPILADEQGGVEWEIVQAVAARDQWNASMGFTSKRSLTSVLYDKNGGETFRARTYITGE